LVEALAVGGGDGAVTISAATTVNVPVGTPSVTGIQNPLPFVPGESTVDWIGILPNMGSEWKVQKSVDYDRPQGLTEPAGIAIDNVDCIAPLYPGVNTVVVAGQTASAYFVMNGYLFQSDDRRNYGKQLSSVGPRSIRLREPRQRTELLFGLLKVKRFWFGFDLRIILRHQQVRWLRNTIFSRK